MWSNNAINICNPPRSGRYSDEKADTKRFRQTDRLTNGQHVTRTLHLWTTTRSSMYNFLITLMSRVHSLCVFNNVISPSGWPCLWYVPAFVEVGPISRPTALQPPLHYRIFLDGSGGWGLGWLSSSLFLLYSLPSSLTPPFSLQCTLSFSVFLYLSFEPALARKNLCL